MSSRRIRVAIRMIDIRTKSNGMSEMLRRLNKKENRTDYTTGRVLRVGIVRP